MEQSTRRTRHYIITLIQTNIYFQGKGSWRCRGALSLSQQQLYLKIPSQALPAWRLYSSLVTSSLSSNQSQHLLYEATNQILTSNDLGDRESKLRITACSWVSIPFLLQISEDPPSIRPYLHLASPLFDIRWMAQVQVCVYSIFRQATSHPLALQPSCEGLLYVGPSKYSADLFYAWDFFFNLDYLSAPSSAFAILRSYRTVVLLIGDKYRARCSLRQHTPLFRHRRSL
jgi:hypothetical protein